MKRFPLLFLLTIFLLIGIANAATNVTIYSHGVNMPDTAVTAGSSQFDGITIRTASRGFFITAINRPQGTDATIANLLLNSTAARLGNATFSGSKATFPLPIQLLPNTVYRITFNNSGATWNMNYTNAYGGGYPIIPTPNTTGAPRLFNFSSSWSGASESLVLIIGPESIDAYDVSGIDVELTAPPNMILTKNSSLIFNVTMFSNGTMRFANATIFVWNPDNTIFNQTRNIVNGSTLNTTFFNITNLQIKTYKWNVLTCAYNGTYRLCEFAPENKTFSIGASMFSETYNSSTYETARENFLTNVSVSTGSTLSSATLYYDSTAYSGTLVNTGSSNYSLSRNLDIPLIQGNKSWFWSINYNSSVQLNLTTNYQNVSAINFTLCGASPQNVPFMNITFKNETTAQQRVSASIISTWTYWLGSGAINKSATITNSSLNIEYALCFTPNASRTLFTNPFITYSNLESPQRRYQPETLSLTNSVTSQTLYLLPTTDGIYSAIQVVDANNLETLQSVFITIERQVNGDWVVVENGFTDSSGLVTFWVNPNFDHRITAEKSGYANAQVTIRPSQSTYTLAMTSTTTSNASYTAPLAGIRYIIFPRIGSIDIGSRLFGVNLTASKGNLETCKFELVNITNGILSSTTGGTAYGCNLSITYSPSANDRIFGRVSIDTTETGGFTIIDSDALWRPFDKNVSWSNTIVAVWDDVRDLNEFGEGNENEFNRILVFFFIVTVALAIITYTTGWEINNPLASLVLVWAIIVIGSFAGFFQFDMGNESNITAHMEKYGVAYIISFLTAGYALNQWKRTE